MNDNIETTDVQYRVPNDLGQKFLHRQSHLLRSSSIRVYDSYLTDYATFLQQHGETVLTAEIDDIITYLRSCNNRGCHPETLKIKVTVLRRFYKYVCIKSEEIEGIQRIRQLFDALQLERFYQMNDSNNDDTLGEQDQ